MLKVEALARMADSLRVYDVSQNGWEGDPEGSNPKTPEANLCHVGFHLADVMARKDFTKLDIVRDEIAPDAMQYGLRIARWGGLSLDQVVPTDKQSSAHKTAKTLGLYTLSESYFTLASFVRASGVLARQLHDEDHRSTHEAALAARDHSLSDAAALLIQCAVVQSNRAQFDLEESFENRLAVLRQRFGIPKPDERSV